MMYVITLGTGSATPTKFRNLSSTAVIRDGEINLFDCGEGTQIQFAKAHLKPSRIKRIFISHFHGDHLFGLPGLLTSLQMAECTQEITLYGPEGIKSYIDFHRQLSKFTLTFPLNIVEISPKSKGQDFEEKGITICCRPLQHRIRCLGWALVADDRPGKFDIERAMELGIPAGPLLGKLQNGKVITLEDGKVIEPREVIGFPRDGHHFAYCMDTVPCENSIELARCADVILHDATFYGDQTELARISGHSTAAEAAKIAAQAEARLLILSHFSARTQPGDVETILEEARVYFPNVVAASDLAQFTIEYEDKTG